jgi:competence protein ComEC
LVTPILELGIAAVLASLAVAPLALDGRLLDAAGIAALLAYEYRARQASGVRLAVLLCLALFALRAWFDRELLPHVTEQRTARYDAVALQTLRDEPPRSSFLARIGSLTVLVSTRGTPPEPGAHILLRGRLAPFDGPRNPGEPDGAALERERGIDAQLQSGEVLARLAPLRCTFACALARAHAWALAQLRVRLGEPAASVVAGELWGERADLPPDLHAEFQETGTVHVLVTAGLHLGVVAAVILALLSAFSIGRAWSCAIAVAAVWCFVIWSGAQLPAMRAACMVTAALAARACGRASFSWNALALAAIALCALRPSSIATPSFALSFSCVGAIFACVPLLERALEERIALVPAMREAIVLSVATQLGTWPLTGAIFLQFSPYAVLANLGVVPCVGLSIVLGALTLVFAPLPALAQAAANLDGWVVEWMLAVVRTIASLPASAVAMTPAPAACIAAYDAALLFCTWCLRRGYATPGIAALLLGIALVVAPPHALDPRLRITALDVGQADSIVVRTPRGHVLLIDGGGRLERGPQPDGSVAERVGELTVVPFLLRHDIHAIDALIISHPHGDHVGGCAPVLRKIHVAEIADSGQTYPGHAYHDCLDTARANGVPIVYPRAGEVWRTDDGVVLHFIGPSLPFISGGSNDINDNSIAFTLRYRNFCMLFTGDAGTNAEQRFLAEHVNLRCQILKVGHHGSAYGTTPAFLAVVRPKIAIISVGRHNMFGHPAPSTLATLEHFGARVYRTDENGAVTVTANGAMYSVTPVDASNVNAKPLKHAKPYASRP